MQTSEIIRSYRQIRTPAMVPALPWWLTGAAVDMDFSNNRYYGGTLGSLLSTSRASSGYVTNGDGTLTSFSNDTPRIGLGTGLLVEEARTNIALKSGQMQADFTNWQSALNTNTTGNIAVSPDGTTTGAYFQRGSDGPCYTTTGILTKSAVAQDWSTSCYVKTASVGQYCTIRLQFNYPAFCEAVFDTINGTIATAAYANGAASNASATITRSNNGWWRVSVSGTSDTTTNVQMAYSFNATNIPADGSETNVSADGYVWGANLEQGAFATSYIPTTTVAVTRAADAVTFVGAAGAAFVAGGVSVYAQGGLSQNLSDFPIFVGNGTHSPFVNNNGTQAGMYDGITNLLTAAGSSFITGINKVACGWSPSGRSVVLNGGTVATDAVNQSITGTYYVGSNAAINGFFDAYIKRIALFNSRLPDATLQGLTA